MAYPEPVTERAPLNPPARPTLVRARLPRIVGPSKRYLPGAVVAGARLTVHDLSAFAWWLIADDAARYRSGISETAGEVFRGVSAVDVSASEAFPVRRMPVGHEVFFTPATRPDRATHALVVQRRLQEPHAEAYTYSTVLGRLARHYPAQILVSAETVTQEVSGAARSTMTAREALEYVLRQWQAEADWLRWAPLPEFLLRINPDDGQSDLLNLETQALALLQRPESPRSMRTILDEFLSLYVGYVIRANSVGEIEFVPPPWVAGGTPRSISGADVYDLEHTGEIDYSDVVNRATVRVRRWDYQSSVEVMQPAAFAVWSGSRPHRFGATNPPSDHPQWTGSPSGEMFLGNANGRGRISGTWPPVEEVLTGTDEVMLDAYIEGRMEYVGSSRRGRTDPIVVWRAEYQPVQLTASATQGATTLEVHPLEFALPAGRRINFGQTTVTVTSAAAELATEVQVQPIPSALSLGDIGDTSRVRIPLDGKEHEIASPVFSQQIGGLTSTNLTATLLARGNGDGSITLRWQDAADGLVGGYGVGGNTAGAMRAVLNGVGQVWQQGSVTEEATFGRADEGDAFTDNRLEVSQEQNGIIEASLDASFFSPTPEQAMQIAQAYVLASLWPVERVKVEQGPALPVYPDDINRTVTLPNGVTGVVESWDYSDSFDFRGAAVRSAFTVARQLEPSGDDAFVTGVTLSSTSLQAAVGLSYSLAAIVHGAGLYSRAVTWTSSDSSVVSVTSDGTTAALEAHSVGTAVITATSVQEPALSASCTVEVHESADD